MKPSSNQRIPSPQKVTRWLDCSMLIISFGCLCRSHRQTIPPRTRRECMVWIGIVKRARFSLNRSWTISDDSPLLSSICCATTAACTIRMPHTCVAATNRRSVWVWTFETRPSRRYVWSCACVPVLWRWSCACAFGAYASRLFRDCLQG
jgi:hypothetical protein